jgi:EAL domain-containing protein (putative c-di-GMP-specific phosphodiesterase class I)/GGDEF domain-containing protein
LQALEKYENYYDKNQKYYDLVISDIEMPNLNGVQLCENILELNTEQVIIILSAHEDSKYLTKLINIGINFFIQKPLEYEHILNVFDKTCESIIQKKLEKEKTIETQKQNSFLLNINEELEKKVKIRTFALENQLYYDKLTTLLSQHALIRDMEEREYSSLILVNIDSFQQFNSIYDFEIGNDILSQFVFCLKSFNINNEYKIYRLYSDNFALLKNSNDNSNFCITDEISRLKNTVETFNYYIKNYHEFTNIDVTIGASINQTEPFITADMALRHAKNHNLGFSLYENTLDITNEFKNSREWSKRISKAIEKGCVFPVYQPIVNNKQEIVKYEVLMRIAENYNGKERLISPYLFLDEAIKNKQYFKLASIIINKSFETMKNKNYKFSINLSYKDIYNRSLLDMIKVLIRENPDIGTRLIIEILESENIDEMDVIHDFIEEFKILGVKIAIDDFGAGYSNYSRILSLNPDYIKIDGSLIKHIDTDRKSHAVVKAIINSAKELGIKIIAEFVHSKEIFDIVNELGVDEFQGFYFSEPVFTPKE